MIPPKEITADDISRITRCIERLFPHPNPSVGKDDFVSAGLVGLVEASYEYDPSRGGWGSLSRWRAIERARELLRWAIRTDADVSLDSPAHHSGTNTKINIRELLVRAPELPEFDTKEFVIWALGFVTGDTKKKIATEVWLRGQSIEDTSSKLSVKRYNVDSHLAHAREQAKLAIHNYCDLEGLKAAMKKAGVYWSEEKSNHKRKLRVESEKRRRRGNK